MMDSVMGLGDIVSDENYDDIDLATLPDDELV